ncbi:IS30 family transposase [Streptococcus canis]|nr:IS30 family transposase [Streptococcus canis]GMX39989.1 IS30 family transposase [Streptococcus canis]
MQDYYTPKGKQLTLAERRMIDRWLLEGQSNREIARRLAKAPQTIHNEVKRGQVRQQVRQGKYEQVYSADFVQKAYQNNRKRSVKQVTLTKALKEKIVHYIKQKYSPEMMVKAKGVNIPISTIYYWIHHGQLGLTKADRLYPRKEKAKKKQASPNFKPAAKSIEERPTSINKRENSGDFEIDTVIQMRAKNECLLTLTDRKSRYQITRLIPDKSANLVNKALEGILKDYPIRSITADNGTEFSRLAEGFDSEYIYYAHPYSSWERGTNENHNRLIRR